MASSVRELVPGTCKRAGHSKRLTMNGLRHTFARHLVMRDAVGLLDEPKATANGNLTATRAEP